MKTAEKENAWVYVREREGGNLLIHLLPEFPN